MSTQALTEQASQAVTAWTRLLRGHASATRALNAKLVAEHGLTVNDYEALRQLSQAEDRSMRRVDLAAHLFLTASGVTRLLNGLEAAGFVEKGVCREDARVTYAVLTEAGHRKLAEASASHVAAIRELFEERFSTSELAALTDLLSRLPRVAGADGACPPPE
jgi:DNA-binding MarR family transcriptional regulator